jgi:hypothetical protein
LHSSRLHLVNQGIFIYLSFEWIFFPCRILWLAMWKIQVL